jgi:hypothetical protein
MKYISDLLRKIEWLELIEDTGDRTIRPKSASPNPSGGTRLVIVLVVKKNRL